MKVTGRLVAGGLVNATGAAVSNLANTGMQYGLLSNFLSNGTQPSQVPWGPAYGGGNIFNSAYGGNSNSPLSGLTSADYGPGY